MATPERQPAPPPPPAPPPAPSREHDLRAAAVRHFLAPVAPLLDDPSVSEILINGHTDVYVERAGRLEHTDAAFSTPDDLDAAVHNIAQFAGRPIHADTVRLDARLPDGSRVHVVRPPCSRRGTVVAIRKFSRSFFDLDRLVELGALSPSAAEFLALCVRLRKNILVSGGTGTGKTSLLNAISAAIPATERIVVIEDSSELQFQQPHVVPFESRLPDHRGRGGVTIRDLFVSSLRLRPDRIVIGEVRAAEAIDLLQAMTSGHPGSMSTLHADRPADALRRLETMVLLGAADLPHHAVRAQVAAAIDLVVQAARFGDGSRRITDVAEVGPLGEDGQYQVWPLYEFQRRGVGADGRILGELVPAGRAPSFRGAIEATGLTDQVRHSAAVWLGGNR